MKSNLNKKGVFALLGIGFLSLTSFFAAKELAEDKNEANSPSNPNSLDTAGISCPDTNALKQESPSENKNEYLFIGCNGVF